MEIRRTTKPTMPFKKIKEGGIFKVDNQYFMKLNIGANVDNINVVSLENARLWFCADDELVEPTQGYFQEI